MVLISRLSKLSGVGTDAARIELANVIHQSLKDAEGELELLATQVEDDGQPSLVSKVGKLGEDLKMFVSPFLGRCFVSLFLGRCFCFSIP
jgi:protein transport protein SEC20